jgi:hypothetical protein
MQTHAWAAIGEIEEFLSGQREDAKGNYELINKN